MNEEKERYETHKASKRVEEESFVASSIRLYKSMYDNTSFRFYMYSVVEVREVIGSSALSLLRIAAMNRALDIWNDEELWNILPVRSGDEDDAVRISVR